MIYAYSTPEIARHNGWVKIGYTEAQTTEKRQKQQSHTVDVILKEEWKGNAIFEDGTGDIFHDSDFHAYLSKIGVERKPKTEWFHISGSESQAEFFKFRANRGIVEQHRDTIPYTLRDEQERAVSMTEDYYHRNPQGEFLWNAKPRFGKTLTTYDFCKRIGAKKILVVTNRPAIATSWYDDYETFIGRSGGYFFVSSVDGVKDRPLVMSYTTYEIDRKSRSTNRGAVEMGLIEFVSLQNLKGSLYFGGKDEKLKEIATNQWDVLVIDEAHEGVDTYKTDVAFNQIRRKFTLHLSGTPFKALANDKFPQNAIFNWTYADEQAAKHNWNGDGENPYATLPQLNMFTYQMSEIVRDELEQGIEINGETKEYAFDLNEFFAVRNGRFIHESSVDKFLDAMTTQEKYPFSTQELRDELNHTFWLLNRVDSARALAEKLKAHPIFKDYKIVLAAGDGRLDDDQQENKKSYDKVKKAISENEKTITLSVGQLTTGITIKEWTAVLMLSSIKSPALYMQAAFRAQNPCLFRKNGNYYRKKNAYVFDFDPARTLITFEKFANDLSAETSDGRGDTDKRKENIRELLNFFPVIGEDENGEMVELNAEKVLSIPRKIRSQEVVRRGFMSDFLFQNVSNVFHAPMEVIDIIKQFTPVEEPNGKLNLTPQTGGELSLDKNGEVNLTDDFVIGRATDIFGEKLYDDIPTMLHDAIDDVQAQSPKNPDEHLEYLKSLFHKQAVDTLIDTATTEYGSSIKPSEQKRLNRKLREDADRMVGRAYGDFSIKTKVLEEEQQKQLQTCKTDAERRQVTTEFEKKKKQVVEELTDTLKSSVTTFVETAGTEIVRTVETSAREQEKKTVEDSVKDHLRGFSRTIPSFLMAYGDETVTLDTFDSIIPDEVFKEVTSITLEQFRFLRDGGEYINTDTGEQEYFAGKLFDSVVFDDSVKEFMRLRKKLANYFDENSTEDIFDYIPPQKTNQIFTPKWVVKKMVDMLEEENPGCFDSADKTFIDPYMKSGLYIAEIVKRLYRSEGMKKQFSNNTERLIHIFQYQVYGLAPTEIIYRIAVNFILGFDKELKIEYHNFRQFDSLVYAKEGTLNEHLSQLFGE